MAVRRAKAWNPNHYGLCSTCLYSLDFLHWVTQSKQDAHLGWKLHSSQTAAHAQMWLQDKDWLVRSKASVVQYGKTLIKVMTSFTEFLFSVRCLQNATWSCPKHAAEQTLVYPHTHKETGPGSRNGQVADLLSAPPCCSGHLGDSPKLFSLTLCNFSTQAGSFQRF